MNLLRHPDGTYTLDWALGTKTIICAADIDAYKKIILWAGVPKAEKYIFKLIMEKRLPTLTLQKAVRQEKSLDMKKDLVGQFVAAIKECERLDDPETLNLEFLSILSDPPVERFIQAIMHLRYMRSLFPKKGTTGNSWTMRCKKLGIDVDRAQKLTKLAGDIVDYLLTTEGSECDFIKIAAGTSGYQSLACFKPGALLEISNVKRNVQNRLHLFSNPEILIPIEKIPKLNLPKKLSELTTTVLRNVLDQVSQEKYSVQDLIYAPSSEKEDEKSPDAIELEKLFERKKSVECVLRKLRDLRNAALDLSNPEEILTGFKAKSRKTIQSEMVQTYAYVGHFLRMAMINSKEKEDS